MKKVVLFFAVSAAVALASCGGETAQTATQEAVDSAEVVVEEVAEVVDSSAAVVDSAVAEVVDSAAAVAEEVVEAVAE